MNHLTATYIDFIQTIGVLVIFGVAAYAVKQMLLKDEQRIERVDVRVEEWACSTPIYWLMAAWCSWACHCSWFGKAEKKQVMTKPERNFDDDSYDEVEERLKEQDLDEEDRAYFPVEESKPPHY